MDSELRNHEAEAQQLNDEQNENISISLADADEIRRGVIWREILDNKWNK